MSDSRTQIVKAISMNDYKALLNCRRSINNIREANFSIPRSSTEINTDRNTRNRRNDDGPVEEETIPFDRLNLLHIAAYFDALDCFCYLEKEQGIKSLQVQSAEGYYPLHYACYNGSTEVALYILSKEPHQAQLHPEGINDLQLLYCATLGSDPEILNELFKNGAKMSDSWNKEEKLITKGIGLHSREILSILMKHATNKPNSRVDASQCTVAMRAVINHNVQALEVLYRGKEDIIPSFYDRSGFHSLISLICETDVNHLFKNMFVKILRDASDLELEPDFHNGQYQSGVCHWACMYMDLEIARLLFNTKKVDVNRLDKEFKLGAARLIEKKNKEVVPMLQFLKDKEMDVNKRKDDNTPTLLESFIIAISKNYAAIEFLVNNGADINAVHSRQTDRTGKKMRLVDFVRERGDSKLKKIFKII